MVKSGQNLEMSTWNRYKIQTLSVLYPLLYYLTNICRQRNEGNNINKLFVFVDFFLKRLGDKKLVHT